MKITPKILNEYITIYKSIYDIKNQPHFWDAVRKLVLDSEADISKLINEKKPHIFEISGYGNSKDIYTFRLKFENCNSLEEVCHFLADEIRDYENPEMHGIILLRIEKKILDLKKDIENSGEISFY